MLSGKLSDELPTDLWISSLVDKTRELPFVSIQDNSAVEETLSKFDCSSLYNDRKVKLLGLTFHFDRQVLIEAIHGCILVS